MKAADWIDRVKSAKGWESDYRVAKELGFKASTISMYRAHGTPMDERIAVNVAGALGIDPASIIIDQVAERSKLPAVRAALAKIAARMLRQDKPGGGAGAVVAGLDAPATRRAGRAASATPSVYYVKWLLAMAGRWLTRVLDVQAPEFA